MYVNKKYNQRTILHADAMEFILNSSSFSRLYVDACGTGTHVMNVGAEKRVENMKLQNFEQTNQPTNKKCYLKQYNCHKYRENSLQWNVLYLSC